MGNNSDLARMLDDAIPIFGNTRLDVAKNVLASAMEEPIRVWFEDDVIAVQLPTGYVALCVKQGDCYEKIVVDCVTRGLRWLGNGKR